MSGGPSHLDIWDLKPDSEKNGGPFRPIDTSASGVQDQRASAQGGQTDASSEYHSLAGFQGRKPRSRHVRDAHRVYPQPDGRPPRMGLRLRDGARRAARAFRPAPLHLDQLAGRRGRIPRDVVRTVRRPESECADRQSAAAQGRRGLADGTPVPHAGPGREPVRRPAQRPGGRRSQGRLRQDAPHDEFALSRLVQPRSRARRRSATPTAEARSARAA